MNEEWKDIIKWNCDYQISSFGRIRRSKPCLGKGSKMTFVGKILKPCISSHGYEVFFTGRKPNRLRSSIHRLVAEAFIPNPDNKPHVNHIDGVKTNNRVDNLEWNTVEENVNHNDVMIICRFLKSLKSDGIYTRNDLLNIADPAHRG